MKLIPYFTLALSVILIFCSQPSQTEKDLKEVLNSSLNLEKFDTIQHKGSLLTLQELYDNYDFISVVYLQDGCQPCYPKFVEWHQKMEELDQVPGHTVLFIIQTKKYKNFISKVKVLGREIDEKYFIITDPDLTFVINNSEIPDWIINSSMLIDSENKIKMVGSPWINEDMKNLFYETVKNEQ